MSDDIRIDGRSPGGRGIGIVVPQRSDRSRGPRGDRRPTQQLLDALIETGRLIIPPRYRRGDYLDLLL